MIKDESMISDSVLLHFGTRNCCFIIRFMHVLRMGRKAKTKVVESNGTKLVEGKFEHSV